VPFCERSPPRARLGGSRQGTTPLISNAGFSSNVLGNQILWNFPDATDLTMSGLRLPGSILAPKAVAQLRNGSVARTVVIGSGVVNVELYSSPFRIPSSSGARAVTVDRGWSMTGTVSDDKTAADLVNEAGFIQVEGPITYFGESHFRTSPTHRIWYSFQPATNACWQSKLGTGASRCP
jgi:hypothetical protein